YLKKKKKFFFFFFFLQISILRPGLEVKGSTDYSNLKPSKQQVMVIEDALQLGNNVARHVSVPGLATVQMEMYRAYHYLLKGNLLQLFDRSAQGETPIYYQLHLNNDDYNDPARFIDYCAEYLTHSDLFQYQIIKSLERVQKHVVIEDRELPFFNGYCLQANATIKGINELLPAGYLTKILACMSTYDKEGSLQGTLEKMCFPIKYYCSVSQMFICNLTLNCLRFILLTATTMSNRHKLITTEH
ncbi:hypothetical protein RFI_11528, partial [Reticulomyxa filosa]